MGRVKRFAVRSAVAASFVLCMALAAVRFSSPWGTVVGMLPLGGQKGLVVSGQQYRTLEVTYVSD